MVVGLRGSCRFSVVGLFALDLFLESCIGRIGIGGGDLVLGLSVCLGLRGQFDSFGRGRLCFLLRGPTGGQSEADGQNRSAHLPMMIH